MIRGGHYTYKQIDFACNIVSTVGEYANGIIVGQLKNVYGFNPYLVFNKIKDNKEVNYYNEVYILTNKINYYGS